MFKNYSSKIKSSERKPGLKKKILLAAIVIVTVLLIGTVFFINKAFDLIIISQLSEMEFEIDGDTADYTGRQAGQAEKGTVSPSAEENSPEKNGTAVNNGAVSGKSSGNLLRDRQPKSAERDGSAEAFPKLTKSSSKKSDSETPEKGSDRAAPGKTVIITPKKINEVQKKVSVSDKAKALEIVLTSLKPGDVAALKDMAKGGITGTEMARARKILESRVTKEEKDKLKQLFYKYLHLP